MGFEVFFTSGGILVSMPHDLFSMPHDLFSKP